MNVDPEYKMITGLGKPNEDGTGRPEKCALRELFEGEIPESVLWRTKAMQCEGVGMDWVSNLQRLCEEQVSDEEFAAREATYPINPPHSKEELFYRRTFDEHFKNMDQFVHVWEGGCRAGGASWENEAYTRAGLKETGQLQHGLMEGVNVQTEAGTGKKIGVATESKPATSDDSGVSLVTPPSWINLRGGFSGVASSVAAGAASGPAVVVDGAL